MRVLPILVVHRFVTIPTMLRLGGVPAVAAESFLLEQALIITHRAMHRAPSLTARDVIKEASDELIFASRRRA